MSNKIQYEIYRSKRPNDKQASGVIRITTDISVAIEAFNALCLQEPEGSFSLIQSVVLAKYTTSNKKR